MKRNKNQNLIIKIKWELNRLNDKSRISYVYTTIESSSSCLKESHGVFLCQNRNRIIMKPAAKTAWQKELSQNAAAPRRCGPIIIFADKLRPDQRDRG